MNSRFKRNWQLVSKIIVVAVAALCFSHSILSAKDLRASLAYLPKILESPEEGMFVDLVKALDEVYSEGSIQIKVYPMARSINNVITGEADFHIPMIRNTVVPEESLPFRYSTESLGKVIFVLYSNKDKPITAKMLLEAQNTKPFPFKIETGRGLETFFEFPVIPVSSIDQSMKRISLKRVDGYIWAQEEADYIIQSLKLDMIHREFYKAFDDIVVIPKGPAGDEMNAIMTKAIKTLRDSGRLAELHRKIHLPYNDWQPYSKK